MSQLEAFFSNNKVLNNFEIFEGTEGRPEFLKVFKTSEFKIGIKTGIKTGYKGVYVFIRIRIMRQDGSDTITPIDQILGSNFPKYKDDIINMSTNAVRIRADEDRVSFYFTSDKVDPKISENLDSQYEKFVERYQQIWTMVTRQSSKIVGYFTDNNGTANTNVGDILAEMMNITTPPNPNESASKQLPKTGNVVEGKFGGQEYPEGVGDPDKDAIHNVLSTTPDPEGEEAKADNNTEQPAGDTEETKSEE